MSRTKDTLESGSLTRIIPAAISFVIVGLIALLGYYGNQILGDRWIYPHDYGHLGWEYYNIAKSLVEQGSFSDPFQGTTGPTAWMPPAYSFMLAGWMHVFDKSTLPAFAITIQFFAAWLAGYMLMRYAQQKKVLMLSIPVVSCYFVANLSQLFQITHDTGLLTINVVLLWMGAKWLSEADQTVAIGLIWGALGGVISTCSPVLVLVWLVLTICFWRKPLETKKAFMTAVCVAMLIAMPWTIRNWMVFHKFIPVKSNAAYELWQSQCIDDDGLFDTATVQRHPSTAGSALFQEYRELGERKFLEQKAAAVRQAIMNNPLSYFERALSRFAAATVAYSPTINHDWSHRPWPILIKTILFPVPFVCLLMIYAFGPKTLPIDIRIAVVMYVTYLVPYIMLSYYERYAVPLIAMKGLFCLYAMAFFESKLFYRRAKHEALVQV